jgi:hypothetical protein
MSSFNYDRYDRRQPTSRNNRSALGFYVPLILTVTVATAGLAAWVWSAREDSQDYSSDDDLSYGEDSSHEKRHGKAPVGRDTAGLSAGITQDQHDDRTIIGRAQGVIRRTPSPQQLFDTVSKKTAAGWAAAGAAAGAALASIREEDKDEAFGDHSRWSEEAAMRRNVEAQSRDSTGAVDTQTKSFAASVRKAEGGGRNDGKRRTVVLVVSAESLMDRDHEDEGRYHEENAVGRPILMSNGEKLTVADHPLPSPRHRLQQDQAFRFDLLTIPPLAPAVQSQLPHRIVVPRRLILCY